MTPSFSPTINPPTMSAEPSTTPSRAPSHFDKWVKYGDVIHGLYAGDRLGSAIDMSADGSIIAVGSNGFSHNNIYETGLVEVYTRNNANQTWSLRGQGIVGSKGGDKFGSSVALSSDGNILVSGSRLNDEKSDDAGKVGVYIFDDSTDKWIKRGGDIFGKFHDESGSVVAISSDGSIVVISSPAYENHTGLVRVYKFKNSSWIQHGTDIVGEATNDRAGSGIFNSLAVSSDGTILVVGAWLNDGEDEDLTDDKGNLRVFVFNGSDWNQRGKTIYGAKTGDNLGRVVSMSADGSIVATSFMHNGDDGSKSGSVQVFTFDGVNDAWTPLGSSINSAGANDTQAKSLAMSSDGTVLAIGAKDNNVEYDRKVYTKSGNVRVFVYDNERWTQRGLDINGKDDEGGFGNALAISSDGCILAIGALLHDSVYGYDSGHVSVVEWDSCVSRQRSMTPSFSPTINPPIMIPTFDPTMPEPTKIPTFDPTMPEPTKTPSKSPSPKPTPLRLKTSTARPTATTTENPTCSRGAVISFGRKNYFQVSIFAFFGLALFL